MIVIADKLINAAHVSAATRSGFAPGRTNLLMVDGTWIEVEEDFKAVCLLLAGRNRRS